MYNYKEILFIVLVVVLFAILLTSCQASQEILVDKTYQDGLNEGMRIARDTWTAYEKGGLVAGILALVGGVGEVIRRRIKNKKNKKGPPHSKPVRPQGGPHS